MSQPKLQRGEDVKRLYIFLCPWLKSTNVVLGSREHDAGRGGGIHMKGSEPTSRVEEQQIRHDRRFL